MSRFHSYINSAVTILVRYKGDVPFNLLLKSFFSQHKKFGSRDRKQISHLCYSYFRLGHAALNIPVDERLLAGVFLCETHPNELLDALRPAWNELISLPAEEKARMLQFSLTEVFPWNEKLSSDVEHLQFCKSFLIQPDLYIRLRPGMEETVKAKLSSAGIQFNEVNHSCIALENSVQVDRVIELDREAVIQDYNSQRVGEFLQSPAINSNQAPLRVYDCCAASGGKSILAFDILKKIELTVSDIRESILINLKNRFERALIKNYRAFVRDLTISNTKEHVIDEHFDLIIVDAPCSGSGTWSRTPEQLYYFNEKKIEYYSNLQKTIVENVIPHLKKGAHLLYITCSVFEKENEDVIRFLHTQHNLHVDMQELLKGDDKKADTLFAALLHK